jgi:dUTP pyrophosphatase
MTNKELAHQIAEILTLKGYVDKDNNIVKGASLTFLSTALASELNRILALSPVEDKNICKQDDEPSLTPILNNTIQIPIKLVAGAVLPLYATEGSSGFDIAANLTGGTLTYSELSKTFNKQNYIDYIEYEFTSDITILPNRVVPIPTGLFVAIPKNYELQIRPRSGISSKQGLTIINTPGTIDSDYRGEIIILLHNTDVIPRTIVDGMKIAQGVLLPIAIANFVQVDEISYTVRGPGGFGHTGITINKD